MFNWMSLLPIGLSLISGLTGGGKNTNTSTTTPTVSPEMQAAMGELFKGASKIASKPYTPYTGQRVAPPTAARGQAAGALSTYGQLMNKNIAGGPQRVSVPTLVPGGPKATLTGGGF